MGVTPQTVHNRLVAAQIPRRPSPSTPRTDGPDWKADYRAVRPKVECKLGHLMFRRHGGRWARVRGQTKVDADFNLLAAAHNLRRLAVLKLRHHGPTAWTLAS